MKLSEDFLKRMKDMLGDEYQHFISIMDQESHKGLRINTLKNVQPSLLKQFNISPVPWCPSGYYYNDSHPGKHPYHAQGLYYIQEPSAMAVVELANVNKDELVLDLCASPGGKSTQIACKLKNTGLLVSNEIIPSRAKVLSQNIERMGITNAIVTNETPERLANKWGAIFDKVFVDAPCSGEGMFRKDETSISEWSLNNTIMCHKRQLEILESAHKLIKTGGKLIYSTCTFAPIENEGTIDEFIKNHPEYSIDKIDHNFDNGNAKYINSSNKELNNCIRIFPHHTQGEGHFISILTKTSGTDNELNLWKQKNNKKQTDIFNKWQMNNINIQFSDNIYMFGDNMYYLGEFQLDIKNIKVLRYGLHLGEIIKNNFIPSHSLAMALATNQFKNIVNLNYEEAINYLKGNTIPTNNKNGWCVIAFDGHNLSLGKISDGIIKNHYPKGLRI